MFSPWIGRNSAQPSQSRACGRVDLVPQRQVKMGAHCVALFFHQVDAFLTRADTSSTFSTLPVDGLQLRLHVSCFEALADYRHPNEWCFRPKFWNAHAIEIRLLTLELIGGQQVFCRDPAEVCCGKALATSGATLSSRVLDVHRDPVLQRRISDQHAVAKPVQLDDCIAHIGRQSSPGYERACQECEELSDHHPTNVVGPKQAYAPHRWPPQHSGRSAS